MAQLSYVQNVYVTYFYRPCSSTALCRRPSPIVGSEKYKKVTSRQNHCSRVVSVTCTNHDRNATFFALRLISRIPILLRCRSKAHGYLTSDNAGGARGRGGGVTNYNVAAGGAVDADRVIFGDAGRLRNELEVVIVGCRGLPARGGGPGYGDVAPAAYAHYQVRVRVTHTQ